jgi:S1-C subfamily serine protease
MTDSTTPGPLQALSHNLAAAIAQAGQAVVAVNGRRRMASSGVHWRSGIVVTADHSLKRDEEITVLLPDNTTVPATLVGRDSGTDLAVLRVEAGGLAPAVLGDTAALQVGNLVLAVARSEDSGINASMGVISALSGSWRTWHGGRVDQFVRPDLTLYPGFSGGALIDPQGRVVGINTAAPRHLALTIPVATVNRVVDQLLQRGRIARGYLGVGMQPVRLPDSLKASLNLPGNGVIIVNVETDSPADRAGVLIGDVLVALDGKPIADIQDVHAMLDPDRVGQPLRAQIMRGGAVIELAVSVGERSRREESC